MRRLLVVTTIVVFLFILATFWRRNEPTTPNSNEVVVYVSHDQDYSQPILKKFEKETGIKVKAVYDTEASKTVGLTNRLIAEKNNPQADVFWNNEVINTIRLKENGVLQSYKPSNYDFIPDKFKDENGYWTGFAARARVLVVNTNEVGKDNIPSSIFELTNPVYKNKVTIADARFGTTTTHIAALFALLGDEKAKQFLLNLKRNELNIAQSNGATRDKVVSGEEWVAFTDTDDANDAISENKPVEVIYPDQGKDEIGTLVIPNTVMLVKGARNEANAKKLINYLVSKETESALSFSKSAQMPLLPDVKTPENIKSVKDIKVMDVSWDEIYGNLNKALKFFEEEMLEG